MELTCSRATELASLILAGVHREYPNKIAHLLASAADALPPTRLYPVFHGCFDWHSAVHSHWALVRLLRRYPDAPFGCTVRAALTRSFQVHAIQGEVEQLDRPGNTSFEMPYGMAWLLTLGAELCALAGAAERSGAAGVPPDLAADACTWRDRLAPLVTLAAGRFESALPRLLRPVRTGEHSQTAFALALVLDAARALEFDALTTLIERRAREFYGADRDAPLAYEPGGHDFLSPCLAEADLMRRVLAPPEFSTWLGSFLPTLTDATPRTTASSLSSEASGAKERDTVRRPWLAPVTCPDPSDGKLAHLDGLNLSRAWMLHGIANGLPEADPRRTVLMACAITHTTSGLAAVTGEHYAGAHWLGSYELYLRG